MKLSDYIIDRLFPICCLAAAVLMGLALLLLIGTPPLFAGIAAGLIAAALLISVIYGYLRRKSYYDSVFSALEQLESKTLIGELAPEADFLEGRLLNQILRRCNKCENDRIAEAERSGREYREYLEGWVHEIKTPITSARLMAQNGTADRADRADRIDDELCRIDGYVEQVLYYARSTAVERDFKVERICLRALVAQALKSYSRQLIQAGCKPVLQGDLNKTVYADCKGCVFVIGQIISNSIKYSGGSPVLEFSAAEGENGTVLRIADNGIGIPAADLPRVFDKGFTGENGRRYAKATGIGLYLCKRLCSGMGIGIAAESAPGSGTAVTLTFPVDSRLRGIV